MRRVLLIGVIFVVVTGISCCSLRAGLGAGMRFIGNLPFLTVSGEWMGISVEAGMRTTSYTLPSANLSVFWYCVNGKYCLSLPTLGSALRPYFGGGIIGAITNGSATLLEEELVLSGSAMGGLFFGGLEYSFVSQGLPLVISAGVNYVLVNSIELTISNTTDTDTVDIPLTISQFGPHFGIQWVF